MSDQRFAQILEAINSLRVDISSKIDATNAILAEHSEKLKVHSKVLEDASLMAAKLQKEIIEEEKKEEKDNEEIVFEKKEEEFKFDDAKFEQADAGANQLAADTKASVAEPAFSVNTLEERINHMKRELQNIVQQEKYLLTASPEDKNSYLVKLEEVRANVPTLILDSNDPRLLTCKRPLSDVSMGSISPEMDINAPYGVDVSSPLRYIQAQLIAKRVQFEDWSCFLHLCCSNLSLYVLKDFYDFFPTWIQCVVAFYMYIDFPAFNTKKYRELKHVQPSIFPDFFIKSINTNLNKEDALSFVGSRLDLATTSVPVVQRLQLVPAFPIDERGFVNFARLTFQHLQTLDYHADKFCSEFEYVYYSVVMLRAQQVSRYGLNNILNVAPKEAQEFVNMMAGHK
ncbi:hypothetical protein NCAS_0E03960 [Naumovozyma castellii]|uniref:Uncharacterized protein n=1 Tax=Naumovozyma castellii TaxID=27288 RepID=G0VG46_NAUCA|nr:hypothetical protein NCAS_0E03960 [Naumovozyma castellii CBS 4309]CCC70466.1 hypothetical protein NCAS_0E03960 [Naumovozyma castellii CBS 4309]